MLEILVDNRHLNSHSRDVQHAAYRQRKASELSTKHGQRHFHLHHCPSQRINGSSNQPIINERRCTVAYPSNFQLAQSKQ